MQVQGRRIEIVVESGERVHLAGPNGSGKTSLLRALAGLAPGGRLGGDEVADLPADALPARLAYVAEDARDSLIGLTVAGEARLRGRAVAALPPDQEVATLSSGEARRLALGLADAPLLLLDEPTEGLDHDGIGVLRQRIASHAGSVVFVDQSGLLADVATRRIETAAAPATAFAAAAPLGQPVAHRDASSTDWGLALPALTLRQGLQCLAGRNGSGKSTLLRHSAGLGGEPLQLDGRPGRAGTDIRLLLADARDHLGADTVADELAATRRADPTVVENLVAPQLHDRHPLTLSRGEAQRVALAKVLAPAAPVYLLDEPEAHLDAAGRAALWHVLMTRPDAAILMATHDAALLASCPVLAMEAA